MISEDAQKRFEGLRLTGETFKAMVRLRVKYIFKNDKFRF